MHATVAALHELATTQHDKFLATLGIGADAIFIAVFIAVGIALRDCINQTLSKYVHVFNKWWLSYI